MSEEFEKEQTFLLNTQYSKLITKIVLVLEYEGTNYCGFQFQTNAPTIQDEIEKALLKLTGEKIRIIAASRTDTGVHAKGQVVGFRTSSAIKIEAFVHGLNYYLPQDIAVKASYKVNDGFSVQRDVISREYNYFILNSPTRSPLKQTYTYRVNSELDIEKMNQAAEVLIGKHDLASFVTEINRSSVKSTIRTVYNVQVERAGDLVVFNMIAKSFLPHQVRNTAGTLIRLGSGKIDLNDFKNIMEAKRPGLAGPTVPAQGLFLTKVNYPHPLGDYDEDL
jgi:tRNA pseudouridine38-40 synthase